MPSTSNGYRYPAGTDPVAGTATAIQNLANDVDTRNGSSAGGSGTIVHNSVIAATLTVTFPAGRFVAAPPVTIISPKDSGGGPPWSALVVCWCTGQTNTGMTLNSRSISGSAITANILVAWFARTQG